MRTWYQCGHPDDARGGRSRRRGRLTPGTVWRLSAGEGARCSEDASERGKRRPRPRPRPTPGLRPVLFEALSAGAVDPGPGQPQGDHDMTAATLTIFVIAVVIVVVIALRELGKRR